LVSLNNRSVLAATILSLELDRLADVLKEPETEHDIEAASPAKSSVTTLPAQER
jgi:hypothetical protein